MWKEMQDELNANEEETTEKRTEEPKKGDCPNCGGNLVHEGGCTTCKSCGWSKCQ
jgi:ribonucleoside-diphosphate reductase alpha chain